MLIVRNFAVQDKGYSMNRLSRFLLVALLLALASGVHAQYMDSLRLARRNTAAGLKTVPSADISGNRDGHVKRPWRAAFQTVVINAGVHSFDRFVLNEDFAQVRLKDIWHNVSHRMVWDNDQFSTNLFAHPYHGGLYYSTARSNGLNLYESLPYSIAGSLMWEYMGEKEPPAVNDLMATSMGGVALGEVSYRLSNLVLNDATRGFSRFFRELIGTVINPMRGLNRIVTGDAWHVRHDHYRYHDYDALPVRLTATQGHRYMAGGGMHGGTLRNGTHAAFVNLLLDYGDAYNNDDPHPYDWFTGDIMLSNSAPHVSDLHVLARIWGTEMDAGPRARGEFGFFHHFNYYDSAPFESGSSKTVPYRISEAASFGPGFLVSLDPRGKLQRMEHQAYFSFMLLGGAYTDYYRFIDRDYNMGSGYSVKYRFITELGAFHLRLLSDYYRLYTVKGYETKDYESINPLYLDSQGDRSTSSLLVLQPVAEVRLWHSLFAHASMRYVMRHTDYRYHPNVRTHAFVFYAGLSYKL